jgi:hypothetical protein
MDATTATARPEDLDPLAGSSPATDPDAGEPDTSPAASPVSGPRASARPWPTAKRFGFRLLVSYFVLYTIPFPLTSIPWLGEKLHAGVLWLWVQGAELLAAHVFRVEGELFTGPTGSGDTTLDHLLLVMTSALALVAAALWTLVDRRRTDYRRAGAYFEVAVRYVLGLVMLGYGFAKIIPTQFSPPSLERLLQPLSDFSPMGLLWTFMGFSQPYTIFAGAAELLGGFLLFFRRTRMLGAMVIAAVMTNVVMMNFSYDVPVKLYSVHLLVMALGLLALDGRRLVAFFLRNRAVPPAEHPPLAHRRWIKIAAWTVALLLVGQTVWAGVTRGWDLYHSWGEGRERPEIWGIHDVETFVVDGEELPPLLTDEVRWRALVVDRALPTRWGEQEFPGRISVLHMDGSRTSHPVMLDQEADTITRVPDEQPTLEAAREAGVEITDVLRYVRLPSESEPGSELGVLEVTGTWQGKQIEVRLLERDLSAMELPGRGFHWINEVPYNR